MAPSAYVRVTNRAAATLRTRIPHGHASRDDPSVTRSANRSCTGALREPILNQDERAASYRRVAGLLKEHRASSTE